MNLEKESVKQYWNNIPCGTGGITYPEGTREYFEAVTRNKDRWDSYRDGIIQFDDWNGKLVLEVGCGIGGDLVKFAQAGALVRGIDLSPKSVSLAKEHLKVYGCKGIVIEADAERIPYKDDTFDLCFSWGVLHHTPNTERAIKELYRVTKSGGEICIMLYHCHSLVALQMYILFGLLALKPFRSVKDIIANNHESIGTKAYTVSEVKLMFSAFENVRIDVCITSYDLRYKKDKFLPLWMGKLIPQRFGWNIIIRATKPYGMGV